MGGDSSSPSSLPTMNISTYVTKADHIQGPENVVSPKGNHLQLRDGDGGLPKISFIILWSHLDRPPVLLQHCLTATFILNPQVGHYRDDAISDKGSYLLMSGWCVQLQHVQTARSLVLSDKTLV